MSTTATDRHFRRVTRHEPCPICGKPDWCRIFEDGGVECMRTESPTPCTSGGHMHWPNGRERDWRDPIPTPPRREAPERPAGDKAQIDAAYRALLEHCPLSDADRAHLAARGLTAEQITRHGYGTLPADREERNRIAAAVEAALGWDPAGIVPGFVRTGDHLELAKLAGILIPFRNVRGQIRGLQVRLTDPGRGPKYVWFSAGDGPGSVGQNGNVCHVAYPPRPASTKRVVVTEGPMKANIAADRFGCIVLAVAGVGNTAGVLPALKALGGVEDVAVAYDEDAEVNPQVAMHEAKLALELDASGFRVAQWTWPSEEGKGIDDLIAAGLVPFPIPHPAVTQDRTQHDDRSREAEQRLKELRLLHSRSIAARHAPNLGAERHTLTDLALMLSGAKDGEFIPVSYKKLGHQAGVSASAATQHLKKVGVRPRRREAGLLTGLVEVETRPGPGVADPITGELTPGYETTYMRRLAPVHEILHHIATAPPPEAGVRNNHGGKREPCPKCGGTIIVRTITDRCADCRAQIGEPRSRILNPEDVGKHPADPAPEPPPADSQPDSNLLSSFPDAPEAEGAAEGADEKTFTVVRLKDSDSLSSFSDEPDVDAERAQTPTDSQPDSNLLASSAEAERAARRARYGADLAARYGPPPEAWRDLAPAPSVFTAGSNGVAVPANCATPDRCRTTGGCRVFQNTGGCLMTAPVDPTPLFVIPDPPRPSSHFDVGD